MNAIVENRELPAARRQSPPRHKLAWLLKREFWEHKGGFFWAPLVAGLVFLVFTILGGGTAQVFWNKAKLEPGNTTTLNGVQMPTSELDLSRIVQSASPDDLRQLGDAVNAMTAMTAFWPLMVFGFVVFFYLLGSLYDERRDRSVLFWKSMPVSDGQTVLSKVLMALLVGPLIASAIAAAVMLAFGIVLSVFIAFNGGNPFTLYWSHLRPALIGGSLLAWIPIYALWALPTAGWLMLCSAWARSKPFLWAVLVPVLAGVLVSWFEFFDANSRWFWEHVVARLLVSAWPGSHLFGVHESGYGIRLTEDSTAMEWMRLAGGLDAFASPSLWIGAAAGLAMLFIATRLRRWRADA